MQPLDRFVLVMMILAECRRSALEIYEATRRFLRIIRSIGKGKLRHYTFHIHTARLAFTYTCCLIPTVYYSFHLASYHAS